jgi:CO/xanthine dehydrogenase Mo-binding subunit
MNGGASPKSDKALEAEQARLARFFETIHKHRKALDLAIADNFGEMLDPAEWRSAFDSSEPEDANRTMVVTGDHSAILNAYVEILKASAGARLIGLLPHRRPHASPDVDAEEVRDAVERLRQALPGLVGSIDAWLVRHGIEFR